MLSSDHRSRSTGLSFLACAAMIALAGCTVQPLYGTNNRLETGSVSGDRQRVASIDVMPVSTRYGQEVRNQLIFLFNGGANQPASPKYRMKLDVTTLTASVASIQLTTTDLEPTAGVVTVAATYDLIDSSSGEIIASGTRSVDASYDKPQQEFASFRAERDAQNRAARELAQILSLAVNLDLRRVSSGS